MEDAPFYLSTLPPILYEELVVENRAVIAEGLNEQRRTRSMRAQARILIADGGKEALDIGKAYTDHIPEERGR